jgi:hypothetical protein
VGHRIAHNLIHDLPHCGILFWGNDITIENNEIYAVCLETGDAGAIYTGRDYTFRGNVIRRNFVHHTGGVGMGSMAIYMDDCVSGTDIRENLFWDVNRAVFLGGGRDFHVENNVFVNCRPAVELDSRGTSEHPVWRKMVTGFMKEQYDKMRPLEPPFSDRYPEIAEVEPYFGGANGVPAEGNVVVHNVCVGDWARFEEAAEPLVEIHDNFVEGDPHFVDPDFGDFSIAPDSPAFAVGFQRIPVEEIGLLRNEDRTSLPPRVGTRIECLERGERVRIRISAKNMGTGVASGSVHALVRGNSCVAISGTTILPFSLRPGEIAAAEFTVSDVSDEVTVETRSDVAGVRPARLKIAIEASKEA